MKHTKKTEKLSIESHQALLQLSLFPMNQLWRFVVDGNLQSKEGGWQAYEQREPGSISAVIRGMALALHYLNKPISLKLIKDLHIKCGTDVKTDKKVKLGNFDSESAYVQVMPEASSPQGIMHFLTQHPRHNIQGALVILNEVAKTDIKIDGHPVVLTGAISMPLNHYTKADCAGCTNKLYQFDKFLSKQWRLVYYPPGSLTPKVKKAMSDIMKKEYCKEGYQEKPMQEHVQDILDTYHHEQKTLDHHQKRALSAMQVTQEFAQLHPFSDYNIRTFVMCLFFLMELKNGYMPPLLSDPNVFDFLHLPAIQNCVGHGQDITRRLIDRPDAEAYGITVAKNADIPAEFKAATHEFMQVLSAQLYAAASGYLKTDPKFALQLYTSSLRLFFLYGGNSLKDHTSRLYAIGLCRRKLQDEKGLSLVITDLNILLNKCKSLQQADLSGFSETIQSYIDKLNKPIAKNNTSKAVLF